MLRERVAARVNGLRSDIHRLFDRGYVTTDADDRFVVGRRLNADFENGKVYYALHGSALKLPGDPTHRPSREALAWHRDSVFLG